MDEPEKAPPWREEDGPPPEKWVWPPQGRPALYVLSYGQWCTAVVTSKDVYQDGRVAYHVVVQQKPPRSGGRDRTYRWPQPGLRVAYRGTSQPERTA